MADHQTANHTTPRPASVKAWLGKRVISLAARVVSMAARRARLRQIIFNAIRLQRPEVTQFWSVDELRFLCYTFCRRADSKSQILQDLWVCHQTNERRNGFFVEFGATNGLTNSNTWLLENKYGWTGILAEPNPVWHAALELNRRVRIDHRCVSSSTGRTVAFLTTDNVDPELSAIAEFADGDHFSAVRASGKAIDVETISLNDLLRAHEAPARIDYMSIDTEGSEYDILSQFDFKTYVVELITVEQNRRTEAKIDALLEANGYTRVFKEFSQWDGWYVRADRASRIEHRPMVSAEAKDVVHA